MNTKTARKVHKITEAMKENVYAQQKEDLKAIHNENLWFAIKSYSLVLCLLLIISLTIVAIV